jgi:hypothetical protein
MRPLLVMTLLAGVFSGPLLADFSYESRIQVGRGTNKPIFSTHLIKGNRMATVTKDHATVVDVDAETILEINFAKKTYSAMTFAQMKKAPDQAKKENIFQVSTKYTGRTKAIGLWNAKEEFSSMTNEGANKEASPETVTHITVDSWMLTYPGFEEVEDFLRKLAAKLGYAYASGMLEIDVAKPGLLAAFEELGKMIHQTDEAPVESTIRMWTGHSAPSDEDAAPSSQKSGVVAGALSRLGSLGRKKTGEQESAPPGLLLEVTIELSNFNGGLTADSKFNIPAGFKQLQSH